MTDKAKASNIKGHAAGHHPTLTSFRAFDIIPPHKVRPAPSSRPIIMTEPQPDNTLVTPKPKLIANIRPLTPAQEVDHLLPEHGEPDVAQSEAAITEQDSVAPVTVQAADLGDTVSEPEISGPEPAAQTANVYSGELSDQIPGLTSPATAKANAEMERLAQQSGQLTASIEEPKPRSAEVNAALKELKSEPLLNAEQGPIVSIHKHFLLQKVGIALLWFVIAIAILAIVIDLLVDANVIRTSIHPVTNFFHHH